MKTLSKIKLNQFSTDELSRRKMNALKGGCECSSKCTSSCNSCGSSGSYTTFDSNYDNNYDGSSDVYLY